jgi:periplasmic copper chaperone A
MDFGKKPIKINQEILLIMKNSFISLLTVVLMLVSSLAWANEQSLQINDPWVREAPPVAEVLAAFMIIKNPSSTEKVLTTVTAPAFDTVEIHRMIMDDGMMKMQAQPQLVIAANSERVLKPGGFHLMLIGRKQPLKAGDKVELTLKFADGEEMTIKAPVRHFVPSMKKSEHEKH